MALHATFLVSLESSLWVKGAISSLQPTCSPSFGFMCGVGKSQRTRCAWEKEERKSGSLNTHTSSNYLQKGIDFGN
jgi:hypothetical protein